MTDEVSRGTETRPLARMLLSLCVGGAVTATAICAAWQEDLEYWLGGQQTFTRLELRHLREWVEESRHETGTLPTDLPTTVDKWGHPLVYERSGNDFVVRSLGRDGTPGGVGLDYDISTTQPAPPAAYPTLGQFVFDMPTGGITASCILGGIIAFILTALLVRVPAWRPSSLALAGLKIALTSLFAIALAAFMAFFHINWGH